MRLLFVMTCAHTDAANWIGPCSNRIRTRIGPEIQRSDVFFPTFTNGGRYFRKDSSILHCHRGLKHAIAESTYISIRRCRKWISPHPVVVHELFMDFMHHICSGFNDVVNAPTLPSLSVLQHLNRYLNSFVVYCCSTTLQYGPIQHHCWCAGNLDGSGFYENAFYEYIYLMYYYY